jgi:hypothetical protein
VCLFDTCDVKVETLFSVTNYNKSGSWCNMLDSTVAAIAQVQQLEPQLLATGEAAQTMGIDTAAALEHALPSNARRA